MIKSIKLANFRGHEDLEIEFDQGLNSIVGMENAGKSTILHAIIYCLFGAQATGIPADRLWRRGIGASELKHVRVELSDGHIVERNDSKAFVYFYGQAAASGQTPVTKWVEDRFGMSKSDLLLMMHSPPNETRALLEAGPTGLQAKVEKLAGVDVIDTVLGRLKPDLDRASGALSATGEVAQEQRDGLYSAILQGDLLVKYLEVGEQGFRNGLLDATVAREQAEQAWQQAHEAKTLEAQLDRELRDAENLHWSSVEETTDKEIELSKLAAPNPDRIGLLEFALGEAEESLAAVVKAKTERDFVVKEGNELQIWLDGVGDRVKLNLRAIKEWKEAEAAMFESDRLLDKAGAEKEEACKKFKEDDNFLNTGVCPKCDRPFEHFDREAAEALREKAMAAKILAGDVLEDARLAYRDAVQVEGALKGLVDFELPSLWEAKGNRLLELDGKLAGMFKVGGEELADKTGKRDRLKGKLDQAKQDEKEWGRLTGEVAKLRERNCEIAGECGRLTRTLKDIRSNLPSVEDARLSMERARERETDARNDLNLAESELKDAKHRLETLQKELETLTKQREKWLEAKAEVDVLTDLQKYLKFSRARLSKDIWEGLLAYASHLIGLASSGSLNRIERNAKGEFMIDGTPASDQGEAMKAVIGLSLRVAMARTFQGSGLPLLLDEVSANARDEVAAMTAGMLAGLGNQVISVTHRSGDAVLGKIIEVVG